MAGVQIDHVNIHARDPGAVVAFLGAVLGAEEGLRPPFQHPGHWVYLDGRPIFHVDHLREGDRPGGHGPVDHIAIGVFDYEPLLARVEASGFGTGSPASPAASARSSSGARGAEARAAIPPLSRTVSGGMTSPCRAGDDRDSTEPRR